MPARVRQALDVESGLNDGLAVPFFLVALDVANAELETGVTWAVVSNAAAQIGWGLAGGLVAGIAGLLFRFADRRKWIGGEWRQIVPLAMAILAYALAVTLGGSGFIAAFVGGMAFGRASGARGSVVTLFTGQEAVGLVAAVTWIGFGALALTPAIPHVTWQVVLYAALSLTVVRMIPVAIALARRACGGRRWRSSAGSARAGSPRSCSRCSRSNSASPTARSC